MICPHCGTKTSLENKFCRHCGMNLEPVSKALASHLAQDDQIVSLAEEDAERRALRWLSNGLLTGIAFVLGGLLLISIGKMYVPGPAIMMAGLIIILLGAFIATLAVLLPLRFAGGRSRTPAPDALNGAKTTHRLLREGVVKPASSVAERTTELLGVEIKTSKKSQN